MFWEIMSNAGEDYTNNTLEDQSEPRTREGESASQHTWDEAHKHNEEGHNKQHASYLKK